MSEKRRCRAFILGAGFSRPAGLPLCQELFNQICERAESSGEFPRLFRDIKRFRDFSANKVIAGSPAKLPDVEEFMSFLDIEHFLELKGKDTWSNEGNEGQIAVRSLTARVLWDKQKQVTEEQWKLYERFVDGLQQGDWVVTFNYDTVLETALERRKKSFRLVPECNLIQDDPSLPPRETDVVVLKMHGSIDWFDIAPFHDACRNASDSWWGEGHYQHPRHAVFTDHRDFNPVRIADGHYDGEALGGIYRITNLDQWFEHPRRGHYTPLILSPSYSKILYMNPLRRLWYGFPDLGYWRHSFAVIGFSLPRHDEYIRQPLSMAIKAFQGGDHYLTGIAKSKLKFVDLRKQPAEFDELKENYSFVDWSRTDCHLEGFDLDAVEFLFADP